MLSPKLCGKRAKKTNDGEFLQSDDGKIDFKGIDPETAAEIGLEALPIRIEKGHHNSETDQGSGDVHFEARHGDQIRAMVDDDGNQLFSDVAEYVDFVTNNWTEIRDNRTGNPVLVVRDKTMSRSDEKQHVIIIELKKSKSADYYSVATAGPFRNRSVNRMKLLTERK